MVVKTKSKLLQVLFLLFLIFLINFAGQFFFTRVDFTKEGRFTISKQSRELLQVAKKPIIVRVYLDGDMPAAFKRLRTAVKDLLQDYRAYSGSDFNIIFIDPLSGLSAGPAQDTVMSRLYEAGIEPTTLNIKTDDGFAQKTIFPMAMVEANGNAMPVKLLQNLDASGNYEQNINNSIQNLEYGFTSAIQKVLTGIYPRVGFTEGNGELDDRQLDDAIRSLSESYEVGRVNLATIDQQGLDKLKVLVVAKPQREFTEAEKYKINYFVMRGGRVIWSIDQVAADLDSMGRGGNRPTEQLAYNRKLNLDDMLFIYGTRINYNLIADANCAEIPLSMGSEQIQMAPWVFYPLLMADTANAIVKYIDGVRSEFVSTVDTIAIKGVRKQVLLYTSPFNKLHNTPKVLSLQMVEEQPDPKSYASVAQPVGVLLEGKFPSVFLNRALPKGIERGYDLPASSKETKMIVLGDGDLFKNQVSSRDGSVFPLGFDRYTQRNFGNKTLLLNMVDYLANGENLIALRSKEIKVRLLDRARVKAEKMKWQLGNVLLPLLLLISFAIFQHYYRKGKYAR